MPSQMAAPAPVVEKAQASGRASAWLPGAEEQELKLALQDLTEKAARAADGWERQALLGEVARLAERIDIHIDRCTERLARQKRAREQGLAQAEDQFQDGLDALQAKREKLKVIGPMVPTKKKRQALATALEDAKLRYRHESLRTYEADLRRAKDLLVDLAVARSQVTEPLAWEVSRQAIELGGGSDGTRALLALRRAPELRGVLDTLARQKKKAPSDPAALRAIAELEGLLRGRALADPERLAAAWLQDGCFSGACLASLPKALGKDWMLSLVLFPGTTFSDDLFQVDLVQVVGASGDPASAKRMHALAQQLCGKSAQETDLALTMWALHGCEDPDHAQAMYEKATELAATGGKTHPRTVALYLAALVELRGQSLAEYFELARAAGPAGAGRSLASVGSWTALRTLALSQCANPREAGDVVQVANTIAQQLSREGTPGLAIHDLAMLIAATAPGKPGRLERHRRLAGIAAFAERVTADEEQVLQDAAK